MFDKLGVCIRGIIFLVGFWWMKDGVVKVRGVGWGEKCMV